eukprot:TRINITY_DN47696_c0_g1_i1.p2 TRINITY_DN47696_c0_g1~~TRINITY_DN47696_c0_g1_i1.p2  ORF type:complete len:131 (+),score=65.39 TRINITY_DN47696_c0_g1_i1:49-441(+)
MSQAASEYPIESFFPFKSWDEATRDQLVTVCGRGPFPRAYPPRLDKKFPGLADAVAAAQQGVADVNSYFKALASGDRQPASVGDLKPTEADEDVPTKDEVASMQAAHAKAAAALDEAKQDDDGDDGGAKD